MFGGKNENGDSLNTLKTLSYDNGSNELKWNYPSTKGQGPSFRFQHTMIYQPEGNYILIYGGRSGTFNYTNCFGDIKILSLKELTWVTPIISGDISSKERFAHSACLLNGQLIVFGGYSKGKYCENKVEILELSINKAIFVQAK